MAKKSATSAAPSPTHAALQALGASLRVLEDALANTSDHLADPKAQPALQKIEASLAKIQALLARRSPPPRKGKAKPASPAPTVPPASAAPDEPQDFGMPIDREANRILQFWGKMSLSDFLQKAPMFESAMLARAATAVGLPRPKRWSRATQEELHRRAVRFVRNTSV